LDYEKSNSINIDLALAEAEKPGGRHAPGRHPEYDHMSAWCPGLYPLLLYRVSCGDPEMKRDLLMISVVFGYTVVCAALVVMVAPYSDSFITGLKGFFGTFTWLINYLTGG
jgi:hypothetical protein